MGRAVCIALLGLAVGAGCSWYDEGLLDASHGDVVSDLTNGDVASDIVADADASDVIDDTPCVPFRPPPRPVVDGGSSDAGDAGDGGGDGGTGAMVFAVHTVSFHDSAPYNWMTDGYDFDGVCTTATTPMSQWPCISTESGGGHTVIIDGDNGRDDALNQLFAPLFDSTILPITNRMLNTGTVGMLVWVQGLDGDTDDDLQAGIILAANGAAPGGGAPLWMGTDTWDYDPTSVVAGDVTMGPTNADNHAYAVGGTIYAFLPPASTILLPSSMASPDGGIGSISIHLASSILTAQIVRDPMTNEVTALDPVSISGVWSVRAATTDLRNAGVCPGTGVGSIVFNQLNNAADILANGGTNATFMCDAISAAAYASTMRAQIGGMYTLPPASDQCR
jgi:hypothetical protein